MPTEMPTVMPAKMPTEMPTVTGLTISSSPWTEATLIQLLGQIDHCNHNNHHSSEFYAGYLPHNTHTS